MARIRTLIVDDSALVRRAVADILARDPDIEVVGSAVDPYVARDKILALDPDVITLDIEMPRMDGLTFLKAIMRHRPMPVVVMSSLTCEGSAKALEALQAGAVEVIGKPGSAYSVASAAELIAKIKAAAHSRYRRGAAPVAAHSVSAGTPEPFAESHANAAGFENAEETRRHGRPAGSRRCELILMGASTGGTEALKLILTRLGDNLPGICVVQHIPAYFSKAFADRLNQLSAMEVREARDGDEVRPGLALIAPGGRHLILRRGPSRYFVELNDGTTVHHQRPSVDVLFGSAAAAGAAPSCLAVLLTGMGADGAAGMLRLRQGGARTIAQDERSCVVYGMPREAVRLGAAQEVLPLDRIPARISWHAGIAWCQQPVGKP